MSRWRVKEPKDPFVNMSLMSCIFPGKGRVLTLFRTRFYLSQGIAQYQQFNQTQDIKSRLWILFFATGRALHTNLSLAVLAARWGKVAGDRAGLLSGAPPATYAKDKAFAPTRAKALTPKRAAPWPRVLLPQLTTHFLSV